MARRFSRLGGHPTLNFLNTVDWRESGEPKEMFGNAFDFVVWCGEMGLATPSDLRTLKKRFKSTGAGPFLTLERVLKTRESTYKVIRAILNSRSPGQSYLSYLNGEFELLPEHKTVEWHGGRLCWDTPDRGDPFEALYMKLLWQTAVFLTEADYTRVKQCADDRGCGFMFLDNSKNNSRIWCSSNICGNRAKARDYYYRHRDV